VRGERGVAGTLGGGAIPCSAATKFLISSATFFIAFSSASWFAFDGSRKTAFAAVMIRCVLSNSASWCMFLILATYKTHLRESVVDYQQSKNGVLQE
jgi:hypothetical protein